MKQLLYNAVKIAMGLAVAIIISDLIGLSYSTTAGVIVLLSILDSRKRTYIVALKRLVTATIAIGISAPLFYIFGHEVITLAIFLIIFIPLITYLKSTEGLSVSTVLILHIYTINELSMGIIFNELMLVIVGLAVALLMNIHVLSLEDEIKKLQGETEQLIISILHKMKLRLQNQCLIWEQKDDLLQLDQKVSEGLKKAILFDNNYILKDYSYYTRYFKMRRQQYQLLLYMEKYLKEVFEETELAKPLSKFTGQVADEFSELNDANDLLAQAEELKNYYRGIRLPQSREEFESRAIMFQYLNDLIYFLEIKKRFAGIKGEEVDGYKVEK